MDSNEVSIAAATSPALAAAIDELAQALKWRGSYMAKQDLEKYSLLVLGVWLIIFILTLLHGHSGFLRHILSN